MSDSTDDLQSRDHLFKPGQSGNPKGRPKGSRNALGEKFLSDLQSLWEEEGASVLKEARDDKPMEFAKMVAGILPKELLMRKAPEDEMTDDELARVVEQLGFLAERLRESGEGSSLLFQGTETTH